MPTRRSAVVPGAVGVTLLLGGCASQLSLPPGELAADPVCARVLQATPDDLAGLERRTVATQSATAWGEPAVTLRCGVAPPGPTTDRCVSVETPDGTAVDWISLEADDLPDHARSEAGTWAFVTYGREPAIEVVVPAEQVTGQPTTFLVDLAAAVEVAPAERACVGATDVS